MNKNLVFIKTIVKDSATGIDKVMGKTKVGNIKSKLRPFLNKKLGHYATGLYTIKDGIADYSLQKETEERFNMTEGELTPRNWTQNIGYDPSNLTFYDTFYISMNDGTTVLDLDTKEGFLGYRLALASAEVANSEKEIKDFPKARYYISNQTESEEIKYLKKKKFNKATAALESDLMVGPNIIKVAKALNLVSKDVDEQVAYNVLDSFINKGEQEVEKFLDIFNLFNSKDGKLTLNAKVLLKDLVDYYIISKVNDTYTWKEKGFNLGVSKASAEGYLINPEKQEQVEELEKLLKTKRGY